MRKILLTLLTTLLCSVTAWGATATTSVVMNSSNLTSCGSTGGGKTYSFSLGGNSAYVYNRTSSVSLNGATGLTGAYVYNIHFIAPITGVVEIRFHSTSTDKTDRTATASINDYGTTATHYNACVTAHSGKTAVAAASQMGTDAGTSIASSLAVAKNTSAYSSRFFVKSGNYYCIASTASGSNCGTAEIIFTPAIMYDKNGGTGTAMSATVAVPPSDITIATNTYTAPAGKQFKEWNTQADGGGDSYAEGAATSTGLYLYAIWEDAGGGSCTATANAGADKNTTVNTGVALAATAAGDGKTGAWTVQSAPDGATGDYAPTFSSTSSATATFTPKVKGSYTLRWTVTCTEGEFSANDDMEVSVCAPISPTLDYTSTSLTVGAGNSSAPSLDKDGSSGTVTWESSAPSKATVNSSGVVTPVAAGSATITATIAANGDYCEGSVSKNFTINAAACSPSISASPSSASYCKDDVATALFFTGSGHNAQKWQYYDGDSWEDIDGATNATYTPSTSATGSTQYRVVTTCDSYTTTATSSAATVTVKTSPGLTISLAP